MVLKKRALKIKCLQLQTPAMAKSMKMKKKRDDIQQRVQPRNKRCSNFNLYPVVVCCVTCGYEIIKLESLWAKKWYL